MKKKLLLMMLALTVTVALIVGATMAWFTDQADAGDALFQAGTVKVKAEGAEVLGDKSLGNVNPGDCYVLLWKIKNDGTKKIQLRTELDFGWTKNALAKDNVYIVPAPVNDDYPYNWVLHQEAKGEPVYAYLKGYPDGLLPGEEVELWVVVYFDGEMTDDPYQGQEFTLGGKIEAVQATNGAPSAAWVNSWEEINKAGYIYDYEYWHENWHEFDPMNVICYKNLAPEDDNGSQEEPDDPDDPENPDDPGDSDINKISDFKIVFNPIGSGNDISIIEENDSLIANFKVHIKKATNKNGDKFNGDKEVKIYLENCGDESYITNTYTFHNGKVENIELNITVPSEYSNNITKENICIVIDDVTKKVLKNGSQP